jgi:Holliday junction resolvasome RuvABC ATP-dependent DNA helicase subunit
MTTQALNAQLGGDYPLTWDGFIGQEVAKRKLITAARSARMRGDRMEHTLLASGTPGIGKTSLAMLLAAELGGTLKVVSGAIKVNDARIASNSPRIMRKLWVTCRDIATTTNLSNYDGADYDLTETLQWHGLTEDGLTKGCRDYLVVLLRDFAGGAGARALQDRLQEPGGLSMTERLLQEKDLIALTKAGRVLTATGIRRAAALRNAT